MIDRDDYERKLNILGHCLTLARVYYDQDHIRQSDYYLRLATEYFEELTHLSGCKNRTVARNESFCS